MRISGDLTQDHIATFTAELRSNGPFVITLRSGVKATRAYIHATWPDVIECGTKDGTVHAVYPIESVVEIATKNHYDVLGRAGEEL